MAAIAPKRSTTARPSYDQQSHVELMRSCVNPNAEEAWAEFVSRYNRFICLAVLRAYCHRGGRRATNVDVEVMNDLVQDVYLKLFEGTRGALKGFRGANDAAVFVYVGRVAISVVVDHLRRNGARKRGCDVCSLDDVIAGEDGHELTLGDRIATPGPTPEQEAVGVILRDEIEAILGRVLRGRNAGRDREIADTFIFDGCSLAEIAERVGDIRESGIKSSIRRTSTKLRNEVVRLEKLAASRSARAAAY